MFGLMIVRKHKKILKNERTKESPQITIDRERINQLRDKVSYPDKMEITNAKIIKIGENETYIHTCNKDGLPIRTLYNLPTLSFHTVNSYLYHCPICCERFILCTKDGIDNLIKQLEDK